VVPFSLSSFVHENKPGLCAVGITSGIPLLIISIFSLLYSDGDGGLERWANDAVGNWAFWLLILGLLLLVPGIYYLMVFIKQMKEFRELMKTDSKALFIKNQDRIEELAWRLHPKYERMVIEKKLKLKVK